MELLLPFLLLATMHSSGRGDRVEPGEWGGRGARLTVHEDGATVELDCAHGTVEAMTLGEDGHFDVGGRFAREHGGPILRDEKEDSVSARYRGSIHDQTMTLEIVPEGSGETVGPFELTRGGSARLMKCR
jgi:hypothetical protein